MENKQMILMVLVAISFFSAQTGFAGREDQEEAMRRYRAGQTSGSGYESSGGEELSRQASWDMEGTGYNPISYQEMQRQERIVNEQKAAAARAKKATSDRQRRVMEHRW